MCGINFSIIVLQKLCYLCADNKSANGHPYIRPQGLLLWTELEREGDVVGVQVGKYDEKE